MKKQRPFGMCVFLIAMLTLACRILLGEPEPPASLTDMPAPDTAPVTEPTSEASHTTEDTPTSEPDLEMVEEILDPASTAPIAETIVPGETLEGTVPDDGALAYEFESAAGGPVAILVEPDDDLDVLLDIRGAAEPDVILVEVDNGFSGELESLIFLPDPGKSYVIQVAPFGVIGGEVKVTVLDRDTAVVLEGTVGNDELSYHRVCVPSGQSLIAVVDPDEELDATLELRGAGGGLLSDSVVDNGYEGGSEILVFEEGATFQEDYPVIVAVGAISIPGGEYALILKASNGLVVPDGC